MKYALPLELYALITVWLFKDIGSHLYFQGKQSIHQITRYERSGSSCSLSDYADVKEKWISNNIKANFYILWSRWKLGA